MEGPFLGDERFARAQALFEELLGLPAEEREAELNRRCPDDPDLAAFVLRLFARDTGEADGFLLSPTERLARDEFRSARELPKRIGHFEIIRKIGQGGMGTVYEAVQDSPRRTVALKVIRPAYVNPETRQRFQREIELLGRLRHPGIAQIYEAGVEAGDGGEIHFFAMEYIPGSTLVDYMDEHELGIADRLLLFARVCEAVQYANGKGVVHRDLKPGNIMVENDPNLDEDSQRIGLPKILDFGVAQALRQDEGADSLLTRAGQVVGTLAYMSPEQVAEQAVEMDARSDVYALGVILYEILTGQLPHDLKDLSLFEAARVIRTAETTTVSTLAPSLRGDVDRIVAKAMAKERDERYASAGEFASDIHRHLRGEPVTARPAGPWLRARRAVGRRRHLAAGVAAALVVFAVLFGVSRLADRGNGPPVEPTAATGLDRRWQENAEAYRLFQAGYESFVDFCDPFRCTNARRSYEAALDLDPEYAPALAGMALVLTMEREYQYRIEPGYLARALDLAGRAKAIDPDLALAWAAEAMVLYKEGRAPEAVSAAERAIELDPQLFEAYRALYWVHRMQGDWPSALATGHRATVIAPDSPLGYGLNAHLLASRGDYEEADGVLAKGLERIPGNPRLLYRRGLLRLEQRQYDEARTIFDECLETAPDCWMAMWNLLKVHWLTERTAAADSIFDILVTRWPDSAKVLVSGSFYQSWKNDQTRQEELLRRAIEADPGSYRAYRNLATLLCRQGRAEEAERLVLSCRETWPGEALVDHMLAQLYYMIPGRLEDAEAACLRALEAAPGRPSFHVQLGLTYWKMGRDDESVEVFSRVADRWPGQIQSPATWRYLSDTLWNVGRHEEAVEAAEMAVENFQADKHNHFTLGRHYRMVRRWHEAVIQLTKALDFDPDWQAALEQLSIVYIDLDMPRNAVEICDRAIATDSTQVWPHYHKAVIANLLLDDGEMLLASARQLLRLAQDPVQEAEAVLGRGIYEQRFGDEIEALDHFRQASSIFAAELSGDPENSTVLLGLARSQLYAGRPEESRRAIDLVHERSGDNGFALADAAGILAQLGDVDAALSSLEKGIALGYCDWGVLIHNYEMDPLRGDPEFERLQASIKP